MRVSAVQRILMAFAALLGSLLVAGSAAATTTSEAAVFTYDVQTNDRVAVHEFEDVDASAAHLSGQQDRPVSSDVEGWGTSTTPLVVVNATNTVKPIGELANPSSVNNAGSPIRSFVTEADTTYYRVYSGDRTVGGFLTGAPPASADDAVRGLALPPANRADFIQEVTVPAGTRLQSSIATRAFGQEGGMLQYELLDRIPTSNFGPGRAFR